jgi:hypothetical protein
VRPPIPTADLALDDRDIVLARVRRAIAGAMNPPRPLFQSMPEVALKA